MDFIPSYLMERTMRRSTTTKRTIQPVFPGSRSMRDVVEAVGVPQRHEVAMQGFFVVLVALLGEDQSAQSVLRNAAGAAELDRLNNVFGGLIAAVPAWRPRAWLEPAGRLREFLRLAARSQKDWLSSAGAASRAGPAADSAGQTRQLNYPGTNTPRRQSANARRRPGLENSILNRVPFHSALFFRRIPHSVGFSNLKSGDGYHPARPQPVPCPAW